MDCCAKLRRVTSLSNPTKHININRKHDWKFDKYLESRLSIIVDLASATSFTNETVDTIS